MTFAIVRPILSVSRTFGPGHFRKLPASETPLSQPAAERTTPAAASPTPFQLLVDSRRPLIARFKARIPAICAANPRAKPDDLLRGYLSWIENLPADQNAKLERAYDLAGTFERSDAEDWHESYTTSFVIDFVLPGLESEVAAALNAKGPAN